jgi:hypothetical protein
MVGVVAMFSWGHRGHPDEAEPEVETAHAMMHHHAGMAHHGQGETALEADEDPSGLLSLLGAMALCGGVLLRVVVDFLRPLWSGLLAALAALVSRVDVRPTRDRLRPPSSRAVPTSLLLNRIAVLRI